MQNQINSELPFLIIPVKGGVDSNIDTIEAATNFYEQLYDIKPIERSCWDKLFDDISSINKVDSDKLECDIALTECNDTLKSLPIGQSPGTDGITVEISKKFSPIIGKRQGCPLSGGLFIICIESLLHNIRQNVRIPGVLPPGSQLPSIVRSILNRDKVNNKLSAYAEDVAIIAFNVNDERETQISDWFDPPSFPAKVERDYWNLLGVPIDTKGTIPTVSL
ncbi:unnamed protein product [Rotaria socialis]|uniref:Reverse transcriptase domain-containing protein n=1 Tax=Rotaria socialis TaxID=392032 RepID=A0A821QRJ4_9BILA|nr:unnamed protein product [Rotaria socialis]CAF3384155.1 unnamed protein product [Rotaria socialis]CAF3642064.1 unnamed protein product [Rotaria socialis]CAF4466342.1 unnamed protein product [Rotaria socialis]CAF4591700.1 unnamed protein product [Rotaria socialis]